MTHPGLNPEIARLLAETIAAQARRRQNAIKGALGQKAASLQRRHEWVAVAAQILRQRPVQAFSYRSLAVLVARRAASECSVETIRKHLAAARILGAK